ncbi:hypothetical protein M432DRAFT_587308 [Thermoascus aurantiacus ATCC 26904]
MSIGRVQGQLFAFQQLVFHDYRNYEVQYGAQVFFPQCPFSVSSGASPTAVFINTIFLLVGLFIYEVLAEDFLSEKKLLYCVLPRMYCVYCELRMYRGKEEGICI